MALGTQKPLMSRAQGRGSGDTVRPLKRHCSDARRGSVRPTRSGKLRVALLGGLVVAVYIAAPSSVRASSARALLAEIHLELTQFTKIVSVRKVETAILDSCLQAFERI